MKMSNWTHAWVDDGMVDRRILFFQSVAKKSSRYEARVAKQAHTPRNNEKIKLTMLSENFKISINEDLISKIKEKQLHFKLS